NTTPTDASARAQKRPAPVGFPVDRAGPPLGEASLIVSLASAASRMRPRTGAARTPVDSEVEGVLFPTLLWTIQKQPGQRSPLRIANRPWHQCIPCQADRSAAARCDERKLPETGDYLKVIGRPPERPYATLFDATASSLGGSGGTEKGSGRDRA